MRFSWFKPPKEPKQEPRQVRARASYKKFFAGYCVFLTQNAFPIPVAAFFLCFFLVTLPAFAYQVMVDGHNVQVRSLPGMSSGQPLSRISREKVELLRVIRVETGEVWGFVKTTKGGKGWIQGRYLDPILDHNIPLRIQEVPAPIFVDYALYVLSQPSTPLSIKKSHLLLKIAFYKEEWAIKKSRLDFLDLARRIGITIRDTEYQEVQKEMETLEKFFTQTIANFQLLS